MNKKQWLGLGLVAVAAVGLAACGNRSSRNAASSSDVKTKAAIVTDTGGVDDKSFNQSAWEGLQAWGKEHNLAKDKGFTYFQSTSEADYANNLNQAAGSYNLIFGVGFALHNACLLYTSTCPNLMGKIFDFTNWLLGETIVIVVWIILCKAKEFQETVQIPALDILDCSIYID